MRVVSIFSSECCISNIDVKEHLAYATHSERGGSQLSVMPRRVLFIWLLVFSFLARCVLKSERNSPVFSLLPVCAPLPHPQQCIIWAPCLMRSRGRLAKVAVYPAWRRLTWGTAELLLLLLLLLVLHSSCTSRFSGKLFRAVVSLTSSLIFLCLILLSKLPFFQSGVFLLQVWFVSWTTVDNEVTSSLFVVLFFFPREPAG